MVKKCCVVGSLYKVRPFDIYFLNIPFNVDNFNTLCVFYKTYSADEDRAHCLVV